jgi:hypothetical protein
MTSLPSRDGGGPETDRSARPNASLGTIFSLSPGGPSDKIGAASAAVSRPRRGAVVAAHGPR